MSVAAVPSEEPEIEEQLGWEFEGLVVQRSRINPGSLGEFPSLDDKGGSLRLEEGDIVVIQSEHLITSVEHGAGYKGGIQVKPRARVHHGKMIDGSQQVVGVARRRA